MCPSWDKFPRSNSTDSVAGLPFGEGSREIPSGTSVSGKGLVSIKGVRAKRNTSLILAFGDEDEDRCRLGVGGAARVIARVGLHSLANHQPALSWSWISLYDHAAARGVVVYHPVIVIPEHVLRRRRTLEQIEEEWCRLTSVRFNARIFPAQRRRVGGGRGDGDGDVDVGVGGDESRGARARGP